MSIQERNECLHVPMTRGAAVTTDCGNTASVDNDDDDEEVDDDNCHEYCWW